MKKCTLWTLAAMASAALRVATANETANEAANALMGAEAVIREITGEPAPGKNTVESFAAAAALFKKDAPAMAPQDAAEKWLALSDALFTLPKSEYYGSDDSSFKKLFEALPPPAAWPLIREGLATRQEAESLPHRVVQQVLLAWMARDLDAAKELFSTIEKNSAIRGESEVSELKKLLTGKKSKRGVDVLERWVGVLSSSKRDELIDLDDIATELEQEEAEELLRKIFSQKNPLPSIDGAETLAMAQRVALDMRDEIQVAHWCLVDDSDAGRELHALFMERFSPLDPATGASGKQFKLFRAAVERLIAPMLADDRVEDALEFAMPVISYVMESGGMKDEEAWRFTSQSRGVPRLKRFEFYTLLMERVPAFPPNDNFISLALSSGKEEDAGALLLKRLEDENLSPNRRRVLQQSYVSFLLALDRVAEAVALRNKILEGSDPPRRSNTNTRRSSSDDFNRLDYAVKTAKLAAQLDDAEIKNATLDTAIELWREDKKRYDLETLARLLEQSGRAAEVEPLFVEFAREKDPSKETYSTDFAEMMVKFYARHNRFADVMLLLEDAPWWADARDVMNIRSYSWNNKRGGMTASIANAFYETGHADKVRQLLTHFMLENHSRDWMYELLLKIMDGETDAFCAEMDALYSRDAFEERPLIWKAEALRRAGRLEEAEAAARHALKVDPTDGESPAGDRVRSYAVLGDILADLGKTEDAQFFRDVVKSVRIAEEGDDLKDLGLVKRSLARFAEAEDLFADAYCVQWRLAEQLREMGQLEEAQKHYEIAFERMPEQFGQVASLCFGCMGIFDSRESVSAAEAVLTRLVASPPVRPAAFYLMGQLREEQKRFAEARDWYVKALEADPDYLDVMKRLHSLRNKVGPGGVDWAAVQTNILRLDPLGRHHSISGDDILDWPAFWTVRTAAFNALPPPLESLFPLTANARRLDDDAKKNRNTFYSSYGGSSDNKSAANVLSQTDVFRKLHSLDTSLARNTPSQRYRSRSPSLLNLLF